MFICICIGRHKPNKWNKCRPMFVWYLAKQIKWQMGQPIWFVPPNATNQMGRSFAPFGLFEQTKWNKWCPIDLPFGLLEQTKRNKWRSFASPFAICIARSKPNGMPQMRIWFVWTNQMEQMAFIGSIWLVPPKTNGTNCVHFVTHLVCSNKPKGTNGMHFIFHLVCSNKPNGTNGGHLFRHLLICLVVSKFIIFNLN